MQPVGNIAVEGARLHGNAAHSRKGLVCNIEGLQHPEACRGVENEHWSTRQKGIGAHGKRVSHDLQPILGGIDDAAYQVLCTH